MAPRLRRVLVPLAAGATVGLVLAYLTFVVDDKPLLGINPDVQLWIAGVLAGLAGAIAYAETEGLSSTATAWGAGLGVVGYLVLVGAGMAIVGFASSPYAAYAGWTVETGFDEELDAGTASDALEAQGFNVTTEEADSLSAENGSIWVTIRTEEDGRWRAENVTFRMTVEYAADSENVGSSDEARQQAREARPALEERFQSFLDAFEADTGFTHVGEPEWESQIVVS